MRLYSLKLENIGPFDEAEVEFLAEGDTSPGVTLLTGMNGTGKTIVLDAIRAFFGAHFAHLEREIWRQDSPFVVEVRHSFQSTDSGVVTQTRCESAGDARTFARGALGSPYNLPLEVANGGLRPPPWVVDFWRSQLANDDPRIHSLTSVNHRALYQGALQGVVTNASVTHLLCHFDYLRDSRNPAERATGQALYALAEKIIRFSLLDGELVDIERSTFTPRARQGGHVVPLASISSGNAYLVQRMISLLGRMYSLHMLRESDPVTLHEAPGLLLIDEAENHLHPAWQKRFLPGVRDIFPNLQIIAATHSPFVLASVPDARVYVCHYDPATRRTSVREETASYQNKPVDEILLSPAFDETAPFNREISDLLDARRAAIAAKDDVRRREVEGQLTALNPTYFGYLDLDREIEALRKAG
ncbi:MAG: AAA family ATPase [Deltaproteobacteria bacterium]|nr:AAA family ATPase [Myxococcales bacterium]MDP3221162.1 AAA family ATPase [Deltaproteobacteria bacterium]